MLAHNSAHPSADLLRQAMMHNSARLPDDDHDHIGSASSTPPGAATPNPDPADKRFPGILASYFGQVCEAFHPSLSIPSSTSAALRLPAAMVKHGSGPPSLGAGGVHLPTAPSSPSASGSVDHATLLADLDSHTSGSREHSQGSDYETQHPYPTPPVSSPSSSQTSIDNRSNTDITSPLDGIFAGAICMRRKSSAQGSRSRRATLTPKPLSNITTTPTIHASHISSPASFLASDRPSNPAIEHHSASSPEHASSSSEHRRLTEDVTLSRDQNTPPRTPRTLSYESRPSRTTSPNANATSPPSVDEQTKSRTESTSSSVIGKELRGKLSVSITEGRGLRPSTAPYVVCQFQWNEYISKGPQRSDNHIEDDEASHNLGARAAGRRADSDAGRPMAIPMKSRQSSHTSMTSRRSIDGRAVTDPIWNHDAVFDVVGEHSEVDISVYDTSIQESFLGHVRFCPNISDDSEPLDAWFRLEPQGSTEGVVTGEIHIRVRFQKIEKKHYGPEDFQILKLIGRGTFGQVFQVRKRDTQRVYAMKVLSKKVIVQKKEVAHTVGERNILVRTAMADSPFIVGLKFSFQTPADLYLVTDYMSGGELFWHLQKEGRFSEDRAKFYIAELILALEHLHMHDIVYRDLKPENILLDANGHIALCDFGLSKANLTKDDTTNTFCGTTEYLAPEVLLDEVGYTKMVDFWSLGVLVFEMCCGWSPFYAEDTQQMYKNIAFGKVRFPKDTLSQEARDFVKGLLNRNPKHRLGATHDAKELKQHAFFADVDWVALAKKNIVPPFKPRLKHELDTSNFDPEFTNAMMMGNDGASSLNARAAAIASGLTDATPISPTMQANFKGFTFVDESAVEKNFNHYGIGQDRMDEAEDPFENQEAISRQISRMSGIQQTTSGAEEGIFNNGPGFEV